MNIQEITKEFFKLGYEVEEVENEYYLRKHGTIIDSIDNVELYNLESLEEKLYRMKES
jgi:hypothetical protein